MRWQFVSPFTSWGRYIPESPRWLVSRGQIEEAEAIVREAARKNKVKPPSVIFTPLQVRAPPQTLHFTLIMTDMTYS